MLRGKSVLEIGQFIDTGEYFGDGVNEKISLTFFKVCAIIKCYKLIIEKLFAIFK